MSKSRTVIVICAILCVMTLLLMRMSSGNNQQPPEDVIDYSAVAQSTENEVQDAHTNGVVPAVKNPLSEGSSEESKESTAVPPSKLVSRHPMLRSPKVLPPKPPVPPVKTVAAIGNHIVPNSAVQGTVPMMTPYRAQLVRFLAESVESQSAKLKARFSTSQPKMWLTYHLDEQNADEVVYSDVCYEYSAKTKSFLYKQIFQTGEDAIFSKNVGYAVGMGGRHAILDQGVASINAPASEWSYPASEGQDRLVLELLDNKKNGFFVDLAARYWQRGSNSFALETYHNWQGICIEPDNNYARGLVLNRTCLTICNNPVSDKNGEVVRFNYKIGGTRSKGNEDNDKVTVTLNDILRASNAPAHMDYLSLDVEDHEMAVLSKFDFTNYRFNVLTVERPVQSLHELLSRNGYRWLTQLKGNFGETVYLHQSVPGFKVKMDKYRPLASASWRGVMHPYMRTPPWQFNSTNY